MANKDAFSSAPAAADAAPVAPVSFAAALRYWFKLGCISFGGPAGQIALMHEELVVRRRWLSERRFLHALNYCMLLPGPEAQQLATYIGWLMHRSAGGIAAGLLFVLPSLAIMIALAWAYLLLGNMPVVAAVLYGVKPAVVAIVAVAAWRIGKRALRSGWLIGIAASAFVALAVFQVPFPAVVVAAASIGWIGGHLAPSAFAAGPAAPASPAGAASAWIDDAMPLPAHTRFERRRCARVVVSCCGLWIAAMAALVMPFGPAGLLPTMAWFFTKAALVTFGGAYAVLPYVVQAAVDQQHWLSATQMIDGLALGETTPGPLIMVVAFVAFVGGWTQPLFGGDSLFASGAIAAVVATFFTFLPSMLFILAGAPFIESTRGRIGLAAPFAAITAAVVGVIGNLALFFATHVLWPSGFADRPDITAAAIALAAAVALLRLRVGVAAVVVGAGALGALLQMSS